MRDGSVPIDFHKRPRGRKPPYAERRARAITDRAGESLRQAEILERACAGLVAAAERWDALTDGSVLRLTWPR